MLPIAHDTESTTRTSAAGTVVVLASAWMLLVHDENIVIALPMSNLTIG